MASTDWDYTQTRNEIITRAMQIVGAHMPGESMRAEMMAQGVQALNSLVKEWQTKHIFLWELKEISVSATVGDYDYSLGADPAPIGLDSARWLNGTDYEPLEIISMRRYFDITNRADTGDPVYLALDCAETPVLYVWPVPDGSKSIKVTAVCKTKDWEAAAGGGDFPVRFQEALTYGLAAKLSDEFGLPIKERQQLKDEAAQLFHDACRSDTDWEDNTFTRGAFPS